MKEIRLLNRYSIIALGILIILRFSANLLPKVFSGYFDVFDKLSIPLWAALYSYFWIIFHQKIKTLNKKIPALQSRISSYKHSGNKEHIKELIEEEKRFSSALYQLAEASLHLDFINITLRVTVILAVVIKILQLLIANK